MTEIRISVDFGHSSDLVWRALTDRRLLSRWFMLTDLEPVEGAHFQLLPEALPGFEGAVDGEVTGVAAGRRLVMRWRAEQMHSQVRWELAETPEGCRLVVSQSGFLGLRGSARQKALESTYQQLFGERLPAVLDAVAAGDEPVTPPFTRPPNPAQSPPGRRRQVFVLVAVALVVAVVAVIVASLPGDTGEPAIAETGSSDPAASAPDPVSGTATATAAAGAPPTPSRSPTAPPAASPGATSVPSPERTTAPAPVEPAALGARYETLSSGLLNYRGEVVVDNSGGTAAPKWTLTITVQPLATVTGVEGPSPTQNGTTVSFTGSAVAAGASARVVFDVGLDTTLLGPKQPVSCTVDGDACAGL